MEAVQRNSRKSQPCLVCGGYAEQAKHRGARCHGYRSGNGKYQYCSREEYARGLTPNEQGLYIHTIGRRCDCGGFHDGSYVPRLTPVPSLHTTRPGHASNSPIVRIYHYADENGEVAFEVCKKEDGSFTQRVPRPDGGYRYSLEGVRPFLYNLPALANADMADVVWVCEGEKDAETLKGMGLLATTNPWGAGKWRDEYAIALSGRKVVILPDNDRVGEQHARQVAASLAREETTWVRIVPLPNLPPKGDVTDWVVAGGTKQQLIELALQAPVEPADPPDDQKGEAMDEDEIQDTTILDDYDEAQDGAEAPRGRFQPLTIEQMGRLPRHSWLVERVIQERTQVLLYGEPGSGKSFLALDWALCIATGKNWFGRATRAGKVLYIAGENAAGFLPRIRAWMHHRRVDAIPDFFFLPGVNMLDAQQVAGLIEDMGDDWRLVIIDTMATSMAGGDENGTADMSLFAANVQRLVAGMGAAVVIVHHPSKNGSGPRGNTSVPGNADTIIRVTLENDMEVRCEKQRNGPHFDDIRLALRPVELESEIDEDGLLDTSCYLYSSSFGANAAALTREERLVLQTMCNIQSGGGVTRKELMVPTRLEERVLYKVLERLSIAGLVGHAGWSRPGPRRFWVTTPGASAVGMTPPAAPPVQPVVAAPTPPALEEDEDFPPWADVE